MSVKVQVNNRDDKPVNNAKVFVKWSNGITERRTDASGIADLDVSSGTIEYINVWEKKVRGRVRVEDGEIILVYYD